MTPFRPVPVRVIVATFGRGCPFSWFTAERGTPGMEAKLATSEALPPVLMEGTSLFGLFAGGPGWGTTRPGNEKEKHV